MTANNSSNFVGFGIWNSAIDPSAKTFFASAAQIEKKGYATSYIPTVAATVTRNADIVTNQTANNIKSTSGTRFTTWTPKHPPVGTFYLFGSHVDASNGTYVFCTDTTLTLRNRVGGFNYDSTVTFNYVSGFTYIVVPAWGSKGLQVFAGGIAGTLNPSALPLQLGVNLDEGSDGQGLRQCGGNIKRIKVSPKRLTDLAILELQKTYWTIDSEQLTVDGGRAFYFYN